MAVAARPEALVVLVQVLALVEETSGFAQWEVQENWNEIPLRVRQWCSQAGQGLDVMVKVNESHVTRAQRCCCCRSKSLGALAALAALAAMAELAESVEAQRRD